MTDVFDRLRAAVPPAFDGYPIAFAYLFGSHATATTTSRSDVDVAVHLAADAAVEDDLTLRLRLASALERHARVGLVEVVILDRAPLTLAGRVYEHGQLLFSRDEIKRVRYESLIARMYHDFKYHEHQTTRERLRTMARSTATGSRNG